MLNRAAVEETLIGDEYLDPRWVPILHSLRIGSVLAGAWFAYRPPRRWGILAPPLVLGTMLACGLGAYGSALRLGWLRPPMKSLQELCEWLPESDNPIMGRALLERQQREVEKARSTGETSERILRLELRLADLLLQHGRVLEAIRNLEATLVMAEQLDPLQANQVRRALGVAHLRGGEVRQCIHQHNPQSCLFPIKGGGIWKEADSAFQAIAYFKELLRLEPGDLGVRWLLNLAYMVAGTYPDEVPADFLIREVVPAEAGPVPEFRDIAPELGVDTSNVAGGVIMDDFDNDGSLDILTSTYDPCTPLVYFHNNGDGTMSDWSEKARLGRQYGGFNLVQADYDNDGLLDALVLRGAWMRGAYGEQRNSLLRQNPDGTFTDVTDQAGLGDRAYPSHAAAWADYDNDGDLDLYIGNERLPSQLFRNNGSGTFTDVAPAAGVVNHGWSKGVAWGDYDNDGDPDLYVSNFEGPNRLYRNDGGRFTDVAAQAGADLGGPGMTRTFPTWFFDVNNDGWLDLYVGAYGANEALHLVVASYFDLAESPEPIERLRLLLNDKTGRFLDATKETNLYDVQVAMGANYGDVDNDGFSDIYLGTGAPSFAFLVPNVLYRNVGGKRFVNATSSANVGHLQKGHGIAFGDIDNDGDQDIFAQMGGWYPADAAHNALFQNPGTANHWITIRPRGVRSNRSAIGARIKLTVSDADGTRSIYAVVGSGGSFGASSLQQEMGLGPVDRIQELEIYWPTSRTRQSFTDVAVDQIIEITEGEAPYRRVP